MKQLKLSKEVEALKKEFRESRRIIAERERQMEAARRRESIMGTLSHHIGQAHAIGMGELYVKVYGKGWKQRINDTRDLRDEIMALRAEGRRICHSTAAALGGYYLPASDSEWDAFRGRELGQIFRRLKRVRTMYKISNQEMMRQLQMVLELEEAA